MGSLGLAFYSGSSLSSIFSLTTGLNRNFSSPLITRVIRDLLKSKSRVRIVFTPSSTLNGLTIFNFSLGTVAWYSLDGSSSVHPTTSITSMRIPVKPPAVILSVPRISSPSVSASYGKHQKQDCNHSYRNSACLKFVPLV